MSLKEMEDTYEKHVDSKNDADAQQARDRLKNLKKYMSLADNELFKKWFREFVEAPAAQAREQHEREYDTNKNFALKGRVQAYKTQYGWMAELQREVNFLEEKLYDAEDKEDYSPEN